MMGRAKGVHLTRRSRLLVVNPWLERVFVQVLSPVRSAEQLNGILGNIDKRINKDVSWEILASLENFGL